MSADHEHQTPACAERGRTTSRREFIRRAGKVILAITVVDIVAGYPRNALSFGCSESPPDSDCGATETDSHCGIAGDADEACGTQSLDSNCGNTTTSGSTAGPNGTDQDEACAANCADFNCSIAQLPNSGTGPDVDQSCTLAAGNGDQSCGDCDDNHESDEHCGVSGDADDLCGHQHYTGPPTQDAACSATVADVGCGVHDTGYGGSVTDTDQHCGAPNPDMDCSGVMSEEDEHCNAAANPSTTSPDENCSGYDPDEACSHYDADESCGNGNADEACGLTSISLVPDPQDVDANCGQQSDPDNSDDYNEGPIAPYCPGENDPDYWNPE